MTFNFKHCTFIYVTNGMKSIIVDVQTGVPDLLFSGPPTPQGGLEHYPGYTLGAIRNRINCYDKDYPRMPSKLIGTNCRTGPPPSYTRIHVVMLSAP